MSALDTSLPLSQPEAGDLEAPPLSIGQMAWRRFRRHKLALVGTVMVVLLFIYAFGGAFVHSEAYANFTETGIRLQGPSAAHPFGTDTTGRDILARTIYGGQISLLIGLLAVILELVVGITVGALAGFYGGRLDSLLMRITVAGLAFPTIFLLLVVA